MITTETTTTTAETTKTTTAIAAPNFLTHVSNNLDFFLLTSIENLLNQQKSFRSERQSQNFLRLSSGWGVCALKTKDERENSRSPA